MSLMMARRRAEEAKKKKAEPKAAETKGAKQDGTNERPAKPDHVPPRVRR